MRTKIQKWGNSLAVRIPKPFAEDTGLSAESDVDLVVREGSVVVTPIRSKAKLSALLRRVTEANRHDEIEIGEPAGKEAW